MSSPPSSASRATEWSTTELYLRQQQALSEMRADVVRRFTTTLVTLASGTLVLSITLQRNIASGGRSYGLLCAAWTCMLLVLVSLLLGLLLEDKSFRNEQRALADVQNGALVWNFKPTLLQQARWLRFISLGLFVTGALLLTVFATANLGTRPSRSTGTQTDSAQQAAPPR